jgi:16S rRNA (guanine966-N2)-methyltransferase
MKITNGKYKFKNIESTREKELRPTSSRVRESIFNLLNHGKFKFHDDFIDVGDDLLEGKIIADIYCGTGIMAFEAISRGAKFAILVEKNNQTLELAKKNAKSLHEEMNILAINTDATSLNQIRHKADLVFMDPPYDKFLVSKTLASLAKAGWLKHGTVIFAEHGKTEEVRAPEGFNVLDKREYNNTHLTILQYAVAAVAKA